MKVWPKRQFRKNVVLWHSIRILYYSFASSESRPNFELKSWSKLLNFAMRWSNSTACSHFLGNLLLVLLRMPVVISVLFSFCEYAGSSAHDDICADLRPLLKRSHTERLHLNSHNSQKSNLVKSSKNVERRQHSTGPRSSVSSQALPALCPLWVRRGVFGQCGGFIFFDLFEKRLGAALTWCWLPQAGQCHPPSLSARLPLV